MESAPKNPSPKRPSKAALISAPLLFAAVIAFAINLRAGIASVGPVLEETLAAFGAGASQAGLITAMPGFLFAVMGLGAVPLAMRLGLTRTIASGALLTFLGLAARPFAGSIAVFIVLTGFVVAGIAVANVLLPAWIKQHGGRHMVALMTAYAGLLGLSGAAGPLSALMFSGEGAWQWALGVWAIPAAVQVVVWTLVVSKIGNDAPSSASTSTDETPDAPMWRSPTALFLMVFFGLQSMNAYIQMGWLPQIYRDAGATAVTGTIALAMIGGLNLVGGLLMPVLIARARTLTPFVVVFAIATAAGYLGLLLVDAHLPLLWAFLLGVGGFCFPTAIALIPARSRSHVITAKLSGFVQPYGYLLAGTGPILVGAAYGATGQWREILIALVASAVLMGAIGVRATAPTTIDDELAAAQAKRG